MTKYDFIKWVLERADRSNVGSAIKSNMIQLQLKLIAELASLATARLALPVILYNALINLSLDVLVFLLIEI